MAVRAEPIKVHLGAGRAEVAVWFGCDGEIVLAKKGSSDRPFIARSVTRHLVHKDGKWLGRNPDEPAIARLDAAEAVEQRTLEAYERIKSLAEIALPELRKILYRMRNFGSEAVDIPAGLWAMIDKILRQRAEVIFATVLEDVADAMAEATRAKAAADKIRAEVPRTVEFVF